VSTRTAVPAACDIVSYLHCPLCFEEWTAGTAPADSPKSYSRLSIGLTLRGLQVWCDRHEASVVHLDFDEIATGIAEKTRGT